MASLGYVTVGSNQLEFARSFYDALLGSAGIKSLWEHPSGGRIYGNDEGYFFVLVGPNDGKAATVGNGSMVALRFDTRADVDAFHAKALMLGGSNEGSPGERAPTFYMSYFRDLDGNKLCAYCLG
jgi:hypothetical protein